MTVHNSFNTSFYQSWASLQNHHFYKRHKSFSLCNFALENPLYGGFFIFLYNILLIYTIEPVMLTKSYYSYMEFNQNNV